MASVKEIAAFAWRLAQLTSTGAVQGAEATGKTLNPAIYAGEMAQAVSTSALALEGCARSSACTGVLLVVNGFCEENCRIRLALAAAHKHRRRPVRRSHGKDAEPGDLRRGRCPQAVSPSALALEGCVRSSACTGVLLVVNGFCEEKLQHSPGAWCSSQAPAPSRAQKPRERR